MVKINDEMRNVLQNSMWVLATADKNGVPNAVPVHCSKILDDSHLLVVNNLMKKTKANIEENPEVSISVWDNSGKGFQFKGLANHEISGPYYDMAAEIIKAKMPPQVAEKMKAKGVVVVELKEIYYTTPGPNAGAKVE